MLQCERKRLLSLNLQIAVTLRLHQCYRRENRGVKRRKRYYHQVKVCQDLSGWICDRHKHDKLQIVNNTKHQQSITHHYDSISPQNNNTTGFAQACGLKEVKH